MHGVITAMKRCSILFFPTFCEFGQSYTASLRAPTFPHIFPLQLFLSSSVICCLQPRFAHRTICRAGGASRVLDRRGAKSRGGLRQQLRVARSHLRVQDNSTGPRCLSDSSWGSMLLVAAAANPPPEWTLWSSSLVFLPSP